MRRLPCGSDLGVVDAVASNNKEVVQIDPQKVVLEISECVKEFSGAAETFGKHAEVVPTQYLESLLDELGEKAEKKVNYFKENSWQKGER